MSEKRCGTCKHFFADPAHPYADIGMGVCRCPLPDLPETMTDMRDLTPPHIGQNCPVYEPAEARRERG